MSVLFHPRSPILKRARLRARDHKAPLIKKAGGASPRPSFANGAKRPPLQGEGAMHLVAGNPL